jgi:hypothetical protein
MNHASDERSAGPEIDEPPASVNGVHRIFVCLTNEARLIDRIFRQGFKIRRVFSVLLVIEPQRADILFSAPREFFFPMAAAFSKNIDGHTGRSDEHYRSHEHDHEHGVATLTARHVPEFTA